jgi:enamine deaminase RidA (YjgF/YER057c/UK114 family)
MKSIKIDPVDGIYPTTDDYVHAMKVSDFDQLLFVSGTMGLDETGSAPELLEGQLSLIWSNIGRILAAANMGFANIVRITSYLRDPTYMHANEDVRLNALGERRVPTTTIVAQTLRPDWLVEIEIIAAA